MNLTVLHCLLSCPRWQDCWLQAVRLARPLSGRLGPVTLRTPFSDQPREAVLLLLRCCYDAARLPQHLAAALRAPGGAETVQALLRLAHLLEAETLLQQCAAHLARSAAELGGSSMQWLALAEGCQAAQLKESLIEWVVERLRSESSFDQAAADFAAGVGGLSSETVIKILAAGFKSSYKQQQPSWSGHLSGPSVFQRRPTAQY